MDTNRYLKRFFSSILKQWKETFPGWQEPVYFEKTSDFRGSFFYISLISLFIMSLFLALIPGKFGIFLNVTLILLLSFTLIRSPSHLLLKFFKELPFNYQEKYRVNRLVALWSLPSFVILYTSVFYRSYQLLGKDSFSGDASWLQFLFFAAQVFFQLPIIQDFFDVFQLTLTSLQQNSFWPSFMLILYRVSVSLIFIRMLVEILYQAHQYAIEVRAQEDYVAEIQKEAKDCAPLSDVPIRYYYDGINQGLANAGNFLAHQVMDPEQPSPSQVASLKSLQVLKVQKMSLFDRYQELLISKDAPNDSMKMILLELLADFARPPKELLLYLKKLLQSPVAEIRSGALKILENAEEPPKELLPILESFLTTSDLSEDELFSICRVLKNYGTQAHMLKEEIIPFLDRPSVQTRVAILGVLPYILERITEDVLEKLMPLSVDGYEEIQENLSFLISHFSEDAAAYYAKLFQSGSTETRQHASRLLAYAKNEALKQIRRIIESPESTAEELLMALFTIEKLGEKAKSMEIILLNKLSVSPATWHLYLFKALGSIGCSHKTFLQALENSLLPQHAQGQTTHNLVELIKVFGTIDSLGTLPDPSKERAIPSMFSLLEKEQEPIIEAVFQFLMDTELATRHGRILLKGCSHSNDLIRKQSLAVLHKQDSAMWEEQSARQELLSVMKTISNNEFEPEAHREMAKEITLRLKFYKGR